MKENKKNNWKSNLIYLAIAGIIFFTPIGFHLKVFVSNLISFTPSVEDKEDQITLQNYNWYLKNSKGENVNLIDSENKVLLINFWATWCPPCMAELPELNELYETFKEDNRIDFYFISNEEQDKIETVLNKKNYKIPTFHQLSNTPSELYSNALPTTFLIDKKGKILIKKTGAADWSSEEMIQLINNLLKE